MYSMDMIPCPRTVPLVMGAYPSSIEDIWTQAMQSESSSSSSSSWSSVMAMWENIWQLLYEYGPQQHRISLNFLKSSQQSHWHTASLLFLFFVYVYTCVYATVCECREGSVCGISKYCGIPNYATSIYLASQGCNKRIEWDDGKEGWLGVGHKVGWRGQVQGGGYRGTDGSSGSGLFWANS